ncbi:MAG: hypothetical protein ACYTF1_08620 [Planctomycetota bacterium]|jgi:hypothetical protein
MQQVHNPQVVAVTSTDAIGIDLGTGYRLDLGRRENVLVPDANEFTGVRVLVLLGRVQGTIVRVRGNIVGGDSCVPTRINRPYRIRKDRQITCATIAIELVKKDDVLGSRIGKRTRMAMSSSRLDIRWLGAEYPQVYTYVNTWHLYVSTRTSVPRDTGEPVSVGKRKRSKGKRVGKG